MRRKIHPLSVHLGMALSHYETINNYAQKCDNKISHEDLIKMMQGIQLYQNNEYKVSKHTVKTIWTNSKSKLITLKNTDIDLQKETLILVPSLINKSGVFNLNKDLSIIDYLSNQNLNIIILDWGCLSDDLTMNSLISEHLNPALEFLAQKFELKKINMLGYCMGGTIILENYSNLSIEPSKVIALATPWDFKVTGSSFSRNVRVWSSIVEGELQKRNVLPKEWSQALFASINAKGTAQKFINFSEMDQNSKEAKNFISVEDWVNDGVDLPRNIASHCIQNWFVKNNLIKKEIKTNAQLMLIGSEKDNLVPYKSVESISNSVSASATEIIQANIGHIGMVVGKNAKKEIWNPISEWLQKV